MNKQDKLEVIREYVLDMAVDRSDDGGGEVLEVYVGGDEDGRFVKVEDYMFDLERDGDKINDLYEIIRRANERNEKKNIRKDLLKYVRDFLWNFDVKNEEHAVDSIVYLLKINKFEAWGWLRFCALQDTGVMSPETIEDNCVDGLMVMYDYHNNFSIK